MSDAYPLLVSRMRLQLLGVITLCTTSTEAFTFTLSFTLTKEVGNLILEFLHFRS